MSELREASAKTSPDTGIRPGAVGVDRNNPWPGLTPFTENLSAFFFGRDQEAAELFRLVRRETLTLLFGQSGLGKSSLLQAGLAPRLRQADFIPVNIRLDHAVETPALVDQVKAALRQVIEERLVDAPHPSPNQTLWEYFHRKDADFWTPKHRLATPVLIFDQFEEIFTLGRGSDLARSRGDAFLQQLGDLIENRIPEDLKKKLDDGAVEPNQFSFGDAWCKVLITFREDYLPDLEGLRLQIRSVMQNRMRIVRMNGTQALDVVVKAGADLVESGTGPLIVQFVAAAGADGTAVPVERLAAMEVEPALLSVVCRELNNKRIHVGQDRITADLLAGSRREILSDFYQRSIEDLPESVRIFVEDRLLTPSGIRDNIALENALLEPGITREMIERLVARRLLRVEDRLGVARVELTHDILAQPIRASRDTRQQRLALENAAASERAARERLVQIRRRVALYIALAGVLITLPLAGIALWQKSTAMRALEEAKTERALALKNGELAAQNLQLAKDRLADYYALRIQGAIQDSPPDSLVARMLLQQAQRESTFRHADLIRVLLPAAPFLPDKHVPLHSPINRLLYSPDGRTLVAFGEGHLRFIDARTGSPLPQVELDHLLRDGRIRSIAFHPRQPILAVRIAERDGSDALLRWDCGKGAEVRPRLRFSWPRAAAAGKEDSAADPASPGTAIPTPGQAPRALSETSIRSSALLPLMYSSDGKSLLAPSANGDLALFSTSLPTATTTTSPVTQPSETPAAPARFLSHVAIELSRSGAAQLSGKSIKSGGNDIGPRDSATNLSFAPTALAYAQFGQVILAADSAYLFFLDRDSLAIIDCKPLDPDARGRPDEVRLASSPAGRSFCTWPGGSDSDHNCQLRATKDGWKSAATVDPRYTTLYSRPLSAAYSTDGRFVALGLSGNAIEICGAYSREPIQLLRQQGAIGAVAFRPDGLGFASASLDGGLQFWRLSERELDPANHSAGAADPIAVSPDGTAIASLDREDDEDRCVRVVRSATGEVLGTYLLPPGRIAAVAMRDDLHVIAAIVKSDGLEIRDLQTGSKLANITGTGELATVRLSDDGKLIAIQTRAKAISIFDARTLQRISTTSVTTQPADVTERATATHEADSDNTTPSDWPATLAFAHGGTQLAHYSAVTNSIALLDVQTGNSTGTTFPVPGTASISSLEFSGDNSTLICGDQNGNLLLLDAAGGRRILSAPQATRTIMQVSISRNNRILVHNGSDGGLVFVQATAADDIAVLRRDSGLVLDGNLDVALAPWDARQKQLAELGIAPASPACLDFWSAYWKWQWGAIAMDLDPSQPLNREMLDAAYAPMTEFLAAHPGDDGLPKQIVYSREDALRIRPIDRAATPEQIEAKIDIAEGYRFYTRAVLLDEMLSVVPIDSPQHKDVAALLACAIAHHVEHLTWPPSAQKEKDAEEKRAFELLSEAIRLGYRNYDTVRKAFGSLVHDSGFPTDALANNDLISDGYSAYRRGDYEAALRYFTSLKERAPQSYDTWYGCGLSLAGVGEYDEALAHYRKAVTLTRVPTDLSNAYGGMAVSFMNQWPPKLEEALASAQQAVKSFPRSAYAYSVRARSNFLRRAYIDALSDYNTALKFAPNSVRYLQDRATVFLETGDINSALADLNSSVNGRDNEPGARLRPAELLNQYGRYSEAIDFYTQGLELSQRADPPAPQATISAYLRGRVWSELNGANLVAAHADLEQLKRSSWLNAATYQIQIGLLAADEGYPRAALEALNRAVILATPDCWLLSQRAAVKLRLNDQAGAKIDLQAALSHDSYATWNMIVYALDAICDCDLQETAIKRLDAAVQLEPTMPAYALARGEIALRQGNRDEAMRYFQRADSCPLPLHNPAGELARGIARAYLGKFKEAVADVRDITNFDASNPRRSYGGAVVLLMHALSKPATPEIPAAISYLLDSAYGRSADGYALVHDWRLRPLLNDADFKALIAAQNVPDDQPRRYLQRARLFMSLDRRLRGIAGGTDSNELYLGFAIRELQKATARGQDPDAIDSDPDFTALHLFPQYQQLLHSRNGGPTTAP